MKVLRIQLRPTSPPRIYCGACGKERDTGTGHRDWADESTTTLRDLFDEGQMCEHLAAIIYPPPTE